jgi:peptidoglycan/xylan/chitin deacetylase (PgdA/CDA1 family)
VIRDRARRAAFRADWLLRRRGRGLILLYHRIADEPSDPYGLCVSPTDFEEHLQVLTGAGRPMAVRDMAAAVRNGTLPERAIGVTFDDAYLDVLDVAGPLLRRYDVPATVFVTVGSGGRQREFWWDELERVFLQPGPLPRVLELDVEGRAQQWRLDDVTAHDAARLEACAGWHLSEEPAPTERRAVFRDVYHLLRPLAEQPRQAAMDCLLSWAGRSAAAPRPSRMVMSPEQVAGVAADGLFDVGAHTVTHPDLSSLTEPLRRTELRRSKEDLEAWTGMTVDGFAYPYGLYDDDTVRAVRDTGFAFACAGDHRYVGHDSDPGVLPRVDVPAAGGDTLAALIRRYIG